MVRAHHNRMVCMGGEVEASLLKWVLRVYRVAQPTDGNLGRKSSTGESLALVGSRQDENGTGVLEVR